ncbi:hypothetical protein PL263_17710 [Methylomonas sp. EFPC3]|uniref:hypothetical protein n=1 Tax=unclassified Methylomonas TaxID=2608980 RepID=UPI002415DCA0|nr:hypothetical protein [Methylomonas sp. EFPC3]WFP49925.1 hypothetical protein PL263_17710 [Methylomonas sp. EFPC3]
MNQSRYIVSILLTFVIAGCASTQSITTENRLKIRSVKVNQSINKTPYMFYLGPKMAVSAGFLGVIGVLAANNPNKSEADLLLGFAENNGIYIDKIVYEEVSKAARQVGKFEVIETASHDDATLNIGIYQYGFSVPHGFSSELVPILAIECNLVDSSGQVLWLDREQVLSLGNPSNSFSLKEIEDNPKLIDEMWRVSAKTISEKLFNDM